MQGLLVSGTSFVEILQLVIDNSQIVVAAIKAGVDADSLFVGLGSHFQTALLLVANPNIIVNFSAHGLIFDYLPISVNSLLPLPGSLVEYRLPIQMGGFSCCLCMQVHHAGLFGTEGMSMFYSCNQHRLWLLGCGCRSYLLGLFFVRGRGFGMASLPGGNLFVVSFNLLCRFDTYQANFDLAAGLPRLFFSLGR